MHFLERGLFLKRRELKHEKKMTGQCYGAFALFGETVLSIFTLTQNARRAPTGKHQGIRPTENKPDESHVKRFFQVAEEEPTL